MMTIKMTSPNMQLCGQNRGICLSWDMKLYWLPLWISNITLDVLLLPQYAYFAVSGGGTPQAKNKGVIQDFQGTKKSFDD